VIRSRGAAWINAVLCTIAGAANGEEANGFELNWDGMRGFRGRGLAGRGLQERGKERGKAECIRINSLN
jgi:hypothetical protein